MPIKAVFSDMDGTLLGPDHQISDYTADVLQRLKEKGIFFVLATGRPYADVFHTLNSCHLQPDFVITSNGGRIHDGQLNLVRQHNLQPHLVKELLQMASSWGATQPQGVPQDLVTNIYRNTEWLTDKDVTEFSGSMHKHLPCTDLGDKLRELPVEELTGVHQVWFHGGRPALDALDEGLRARYDGKLDWTFSAATTIDCGPVEASKGNAVREVADVLGVSLSEVACFGDSMNDESMLQIAGKAFIMANGAAELKAAVAHAEGIGANVEDGVARKLEDLFLS